MDIKKYGKKLLFGSLIAASLFSTNAMAMNSKGNSTFVGATIGGVGFDSKYIDDTLVYGGEVGYQGRIGRSNVVFGSSIELGYLADEFRNESLKTSVNIDLGYKFRNFIPFAHLEGGTIGFDNGETYYGFGGGLEYRFTRHFSLYGKYSLDTFDTFDGETWSVNARWHF